MAEKLPRFLTPKEVTAMFEAAQASSRDRLMLRCLFSLGVRNAELLNLNVEHIDLINQTVKVVQGKGKKDRYVSIPTEALAKELRAWIGKRYDGPLFNVSDRHLRRIVKHYAATAGLRNAREVHPHTLRHSYATFLQNSGVPLNAIQMMLGHKNIETTTIYIQLGIERVKGMVDKAFRELSEK